jgi:N-acetylglucosamine-6-phosphate deacetylase
MSVTRRCGHDVLRGAPVWLGLDRVIEAVESPAPPAPGAWLAPGFVDLQVNGFAGVDYNDPDVTLEGIARSLQALFSTGVTRLLPTVITGAPADMMAAVRKLAEARRQLPEGEAIAGIHMEGPHISPEDGPRGAHPAQWVRPPDLDEFERMQEAAEGLIRLVTLAPEWPQATRYIEALVSRGVTVAIGHTAATGEQIREAVRAGASVSTHLGNGAHMILPRHPNYIWEQLAEDRLMAGFIVDGIHLPACFLKVALRAKGVDRSFLVTDATAPAGCPPGRYRLGNRKSS